MTDSGTPEIVEASEAAPEFHSGFVAFVGRPNTGKSTLLNALIGSKVAIVSDKPQTTRHRLRGIVETDSAQIVIVDTPGLHKPQDALGEELNRSALLALADVDVACLFIDASMPVGRGDAWVAQHLGSAPKRVLVITKADLVDQATVIKQLEAARTLSTFDDEIVVSSVAQFNLDGMVATLELLLPEGPAYFPKGMTTDQQIETRLAEFIREKVLMRTREEVPHSVGVVIEDLSYDRKKDVTAIAAIIFVEHDSQRGIIVGAGGEMIKAIGIEARADIEELLKTRVYLDLRVKIRKDWRRDASQIRRFGYGEGL